MTEQHQFTAMHFLASILNSYIQKKDELYYAIPDFSQHFASLFCIFGEQILTPVSIESVLALHILARRNIIRLI